MSVGEAPMHPAAPALRIEGDFTVAAAAALRNQLLDALAADSGTLTLDLAEEIGRAHV